MTPRLLLREEMLLQVKACERTRSLMLWHDGSSVAGHSTLLMLVGLMYDTAVYKTSEELSDIDIDIQSEVEKPEIYILARCKSSTEPQLEYAGVRIQDLREMEKTLEVDGITITDQMRAFHGDMPAQAVESGQQRGGKQFSYFSVHISFKNEDLHISFKFQQNQLFLVRQNSPQNSFNMLKMYILIEPIGLHAKIKSK